MPVFVLQSHRRQHRSTIDTYEVVDIYAEVVTYEGVEGRVGGHPSHFVDGLEGEDVLIVVGASQGAAGAAAGAQVSRREGCWSSWVGSKHTNTQQVKPQRRSMRG